MASVIINQGATRPTTKMSYFQIQLDYTAGNGSITVNSISGHNTNPYGSYDYYLRTSSPGMLWVKVKIGGVEVANLQPNLYISPYSYCINFAPGWANWQLSGTATRSGIEGNNEVEITIGTTLSDPGVPDFVNSVFRTTIDAGTSYVPVNPELNIGVSSSNINNIDVTLNSYQLTDLSSYNYSFRIYSDPQRTQLVWSKTGTSINDFPFSWTYAKGGTTYYWALDATGINSRTGQTVYMPTRTGTVTSQLPWINTETFTYTASPLYNNHWTPRTQVSYSITESTSSDSHPSVTFSHYQIETSLNGLNVNTKSHNVTSRTGTISLVDTTKFLRAAKPRDLVYIKVRVVCVDSIGNSYYSNWFGILTAQYIYNKFHVYLSNQTINDELRINSKIMFSNKTNENYWNIGEVS